MKGSTVYFNGCLYLFFPQVKSPTSAAKASKGLLLLMSVLMISTNLCVLQFWSVGSLLSPNTTTLDTKCSCSVLCGFKGHSKMNFSFLQQGSPVSEGLNSPCFPKSHFVVVVVVVVTQLKPNKRFLHTITSHLELVEGAICLSSPQLETSRFARLSPH